MKNLSVIVLALFLFSCSVSKQNQKAVNRVKADINLLNDVGNSWQQLHPCAVDTVVQFKAGNEVVRYDTLDYSHTDTLYSVDSKIITQYKTITKYVSKTDTLIRYQVDKRGEQIALDQVNVLTGQNAQLKTENSELKKEANKTRWWLIGASVVILGLSFIVVRNFFTPKIK